MWLREAKLLRDAAKQFRCLATGKVSGPWLFDGAMRPCPCPPCQAQSEVLKIAEELDAINHREDIS